MKEIKQEMINSINMLPQNTESFKLLKKMLIRRINEDKRYGVTTPKLTGIEARFQEDMIDEMDSQY
jgi:hypothetical protein